MEFVYKAQAGSRCHCGRSAFYMYGGIFLCRAHFEETKLFSLLQRIKMQNGPPLLRWEKEWKETMEKIYAFLEKHEK